MVPSPEELAQLFRLDGHVAIVTGASSGLGRRFTNVLSAAGANVIAAARRLDRLQEVASECGATPVQCDVTRVEDLERVVDVAVTQFGRIDVLVNNAGIGNVVPAEEESIQAFRSVVDVNLVGLFALSQLAAREMIHVGAGSIVNVASIMGLVASTPVRQASYCATKGAVISLSRELAVQWARNGVRVNALAPGWFPSELTEEMIGDERSEAYVTANTPLGRFGGEHELDGALLFLASDASAYVTGHTLVVDGGWTAR